MFKNIRARLFLLGEIKLPHDRFYFCQSNPVRLPLVVIFFNRMEQAFAECSNGQVEAYYLTWEVLHKPL